MAADGPRRPARPERHDVRRGGPAPAAAGGGRGRADLGRRVANAGDSRGLLFRPGAGGAETLVASEDHKPDRPDELARIARAAAQRSDRRGASVAGAARATRRPIRCAQRARAAS